MIRTPVRAALLVAGALLATGCGSVTDDDTVARVGDAELTNEQFEQLATYIGNTDPDRVAGQDARDIVGAFVTVELIRSDLDRLGVDHPPSDESSEFVDRFVADLQALGPIWQGLNSEQLADADLREWYDAAGRDNAVVCAQHILVDDRATAEAAIQRLENGEDFGELAFELSTDASSAGSNGSVGCRPPEDFGTTFIPEFADAALALEPGEVSAPIESEFGVHVIRLTPFDGLAVADVALVRQAAVSDWADVEISPEIGEFTNFAVNPLG